MADPGALQLVRDLYEQLHRRRFPIGPPDLAALRQALSAGFGWASHEALRDLIVALWAKSVREADIVRALFARLAWPPGWSAEAAERPLPAPIGAVPEPIHPAPTTPPMPSGPRPAGTAPGQPVTRRLGSLPPLTLAGVTVGDTRLVFVEQHPLTHREIAQAFRRLRRPVRTGPSIELDLAATVLRRSGAGVPTPPVLVPRRRNSARLALFVDVQGSMLPYAPFVQAFCEAVRDAGLLQQTLLHYFHDLPAEGADRSLLDGLGVADGAFFPALDPVLSRIEPLREGEVFLDPQLEHGVALADVLRSFAPGTVALIVGDAGAARGRADLGRLLDSLAFAKALQRHAGSVAWLNPVPRPLWAHSVAAQLARHVPMYALDRTGIHAAVNALRGQPVNLERPL